MEVPEEGLNNPWIGLILEDEHLRVMEGGEERPMAVAIWMGQDERGLAVLSNEVALVEEKMDALVRAFERAKTDPAVPIGPPEELVVADQETRDFLHRSDAFPKLPIYLVPKVAEIKDDLI